jgi:hypothetical protein
VQDLLSLVIDVLNRVARELPDAPLDWPDEHGGAANAMYGLTPDLSTILGPFAAENVTPAEADEESSIADSDIADQSPQEGPSAQ